TTCAYCRIYNILDEDIAKRISYNHLKSFSFVFTYVCKALEILLDEEDTQDFDLPNTIEIAYENEGSMKWIISLTSTDNVCVDFKDQKDYEENCISFNIKNIISYKILKNEDLLLITKNDGIHVYSMNDSGKIYQKFNSNLYIDEKVNKKNVEKFINF